MPSKARQGRRRTGQRRGNAPSSSTHAASDESSQFEVLQRHLGNQRIGRLLSYGANGIQRYPVPPDLSCDEVVPWLDTSSPYSPEWAETRTTLPFNGQARIRYTTLPDGSVEAHVTGHNGLSVSVNSPIDRPQWSPSRRSNRAAVVAAWQAMRATLDAHA